MTKSEFEKGLGRIISEHDYEIIEEVYAFYPEDPIPSGFYKGSEELENFYVKLYMVFGIKIFKDMLERARKMEKYLEELNQIKEQKVFLSNPEKVKEKLKELNRDEKILEKLIKSL